MLDSFNPSYNPACSPILRVENVTIRYQTDDHHVTATDRVSFDVFESDRFVLLGPSGCGKSTLLKSIGGYIPPTAGDVRLKGKKVTEPGPDRVLVFQEFDQLLPWKTVRQNVIFALINGGRCKTEKEADSIALHYLDKVKLSKFKDNYPHTLSGGMKQRVAIARGLAMKPSILLMDEPFAALDALTRLQMQDELLELWEETKFTLLFVTHSIEEAIVVGSRILVLSPHPGQVRAELNSHKMTRGEAGASEFSALHDRIYEMLFVEKPTARAGA
ncbi:ABC transporter ATP-binding protein [Microvirga guangxiensis]|uniref:NitT/TauT family transport system ATP-binding protein n=1 Tax=Microvirga guangxiensis TaxID=549386 RepID=A0A1G5F238_9HYPH|nr:ABC transporter ATP-binding protein [Microvirga guangxiensis]SCY33267.1 NitT/TauT family transport system ATP-binding protein [Microvirga guangxiensis]